MSYPQLLQGVLRVSTVSILNFLTYLEIVLCLAGLVILLARRQWKDYSWLGIFLAVRSGSDLLLIAIHRIIGPIIGYRIAYNYYACTYWVSEIIESVLSLMIVYGVFKLAMSPLKGLQTLGMLVFKWAVGISIAVALGNAFTPNTQSSFLLTAIGQLQRTQSILTLCLLLFVGFAIRPMGLSYRSRIFGVGLGVGVMSANDLAQSAWLTFHSDMGSTYNIILGGVSCAIFLLWNVYFALPEPKRRIIVLPTTSPFLRWNQISQALGDEPGFVAVGGVPPEVFAPAELEVMRRASAKMPTTSAAPMPKVTDFPSPIKRTASSVV